jgi:hypothetical protein
VKVNGKLVAVKKVGDLGKPGSPGHSVELEVRYSRRQVFRFMVPFLVASLGFAEENQNERPHEMASDNE